MTQKDITNRFKGDIIIWIVISILCVYSALAVYSGIAGRAEKAASSAAEYSYLLRHVFIMVVGLILMWGVHLIKWHNALQKAALPLLIVSWVLLIVTILFGKEVAGAKRWIDAGAFLIQTSDIAKVSLVIYLSTIFANIKNYEKSFKQMLKWVYIPVLITCGLIGKDDNSTAMILFAVVVMLMFFARISIKKILTLIGIFIVGVALAFLVISLTGSKSDNRMHTGMNRITRFFEDKEPYTQEFKAKLAVAEGKIVGKGPGKSDKRYKLANIESDYIFSIIVEEYGLLIGAIPIIVLFLILTFRGIKIALNSSRRFSAYLVLGITFMYVLQAFINIGVSVDCLPVTGQPMPFVSKGGSMFIMCCIAFGFVLSESRVNDEERIAKELAEVEGDKEIKGIKEIKEGEEA